MAPKMFKPPKAFKCCSVPADYCHGENKNS